jgi:hypothetical protein
MKVFFVQKHGEWLFHTRHAPWPFLPLASTPAHRLQPTNPTMVHFFFLSPSGSYWQAPLPLQWPPSGLHALLLCRTSSFSRPPRVLSAAPSRRNRWLEAAHEAWWEVERGHGKVVYSPSMVASASANRSGDEADGRESGDEMFVLEPLASPAFAIEK